MHDSYYLGVGCSLHDSAIAIVDARGEPLFAEAAEREAQVKRAFGLPPDGINAIDRLLARYCPSALEIVVAKSWGREHRARGLAAQRELERSLARQAGNDAAGASFLRAYQEYI